MVKPMGLDCCHCEMLENESDGERARPGPTGVAPADGAAEARQRGGAGGALERGEEEGTLPSGD